LRNDETQITSYYNIKKAAWKIDEDLNLIEFEQGNSSQIAEWSILFGSPEKIIISQQNHIICHFS
jgi:hypothetical protein